ncbi:hypothetical protein ACMHYB_02945 [Sorangium sp. So ce1128]
MLAAKFGEHVDDQWSVDELLTLARAERTRLATGVVSAVGA